MWEETAPLKRAVEVEEAELGDRSRFFLLFCVVFCFFSPISRYVAGLVVSIMICHGKLVADRP